MCLMDDILVHSRDQREHDEYLQEVLHCLQETGLLVVSLLVAISPSICMIEKMRTLELSPIGVRF